MSTLLLCVVLSAALVVAISALVLALNPKYRAGIFGTAGLALMGVAASARVVHLLQVEDIETMHPVTILLWVGLALFLGRLCLCFLNRTTRADWYEAEPKR
jgi:uncharacterized membrane protein YgdD (TMEM256/DUF423 family)